MSEGGGALTPPLRAPEKWFYPLAGSTWPPPIPLALSPPFSIPCPRSFCRSHTYPHTYSRAQHTRQAHTCAPPLSHYLHADSRSSPQPSPHSAPWGTHRKPRAQGPGSHFRQVPSPLWASALSFPAIRGAGEDTPSPETLPVQHPGHL